MRKAILAALAVLCSVGATETTPENHILAQKDTEQGMVAQCSGGSSRKTRSTSRRRVADDQETQGIARCGKRSRKCSDCDSQLLAGKCKDGNCKRPGSSRSVA